MLLIGVLGGLGAALYSIMADEASPLPDYAVARVNDSYIARAVYERAVNAMAADKRSPLTAGDRRHILDRLIDEELLIQYGIQQGLVRNDRQVKSTLVQAVIRAKSLEAEAREISDDEARAFFEENRQLFARTDRVRVGIIRVPATDERTLEQARARARQAVVRLSEGVAYDRVEHEYHEGGVLNLPDTPLPHGKLVDYLGPSLAELAFEMEAGQAGDPVLIGQAWQVLYVHERLQAPQLSFEEAKMLVLNEMRRRSAENIVRRSLNEMRSSESIRIAEDLQ